MSKSVVKPLKGNVKLITLDPGHFHAALVQKQMYPGVDSVVNVYGLEGVELKAHLALVTKYNTRGSEPTHWKEEVYNGTDYLEKMLSQKKGNVVVLAGNNSRKTDYIKMCVESGYNVLADKPMAIDPEGFKKLESAYQTAQKNGVLLYDVMTERYEINSILQKEFSQQKEIFGELVKGTIENPAIIKESVHHFFKYVSGAPLVRPAWYYDVKQQAEGLVDVTTHLVDLVQWECFPDQILDYKTDIKMLAASRWATPITLAQYKLSTGQNEFPFYLQSALNNQVLQVFANGEMNYTLKGVHAKVAVKWDFQAPEGTGDTHFSTIRGTKANVIIRQGKEQQYKPMLYIEPVAGHENLEPILAQTIKNLQQKY
ncbi:MAG: oxidoreductase, partial [Chitinophagaceae bacterium]